MLFELRMMSLTRFRFEWPATGMENSSAARGSFELGVQPGHFYRLGDDVRIGLQIGLEFVEIGLADGRDDCLFAASRGLHGVGDLSRISASALLSW